jgi:hypothetical protein
MEGLNLVVDMARNILFSAFMPVVKNLEID